MKEPIYMSPKWHTYHVLSISIRLPAIEELLQPEVQLQGPHEQPLPTKIELKR